MHKRLKISTLFLTGLTAASTVLSGACSSSSGNNTGEEITGEEILFADPTIYTENGKYYLTGTRNREPLGFSLLESTDLKSWHAARPDSMILRGGVSTFGTKGFWAPQIIKTENNYWFTYTADEQTVLAKSSRLNGDYTQDVITPIDNSEKNIDSFLFRDDDDKWYLYHVRFDKGNFLWVGEFNPATGSLVEGTLSRCFKNDQPWEATAAYNSAPIMEGPTVIKLDGKYYLFYSANHFMSPDYAVGYAVADSPKGPWTKNENNPIIHRNIVGEKGSGHGDLFADNDGNYRYVYHVHNSDSVVSPRRTRILTLNFNKNPETGVYDITADPNSIIKPLISDKTASNDQ